MGSNPATVEDDPNIQIKESSEEIDQEMEENKEDI